MQHYKGKSATPSFDQLKAKPLPTLNAKWSRHDAGDEPGHSISYKIVYAHSEDSVWRLFGPLATYILPAKTLIRLHEFAWADLWLSPLVK